MVVTAKYNSIIEKFCINLIRKLHYIFNFHYNPYQEEKIDLTSLSKCDKCNKIVYM